MPIRKTIFSNNHYYHIYNRGVEKRTIFMDSNDSDTFLEILTYYLVPKNKNLPAVFSRKPQVKIADSVSLLAFSLMPNHFHLLIKQIKEAGIKSLMHALGTTYSKYFNKKYERVGSLFQGRFKAKLVNKDEYLLYLSKYIHINPQDIWNKPLLDYPYSSYRFYVHGGPKEFIDTKTVLSYFSSEHKHLSYQAFVEEIETDFSSIDPLLLE